MTITTRLPSTTSTPTGPGSRSAPPRPSPTNTSPPSTSTQRPMAASAAAARVGKPTASSRIADCSLPRHSVEHSRPLGNSKTVSLAEHAAATKPRTTTTESNDFIPSVSHNTRARRPALQLSLRQRPGAVPLGRPMIVDHPVTCISVRDIYRHEQLRKPPPCLKKRSGPCYRIRTSLVLSFEHSARRYWDPTHPDCG